MKATRKYLFIFYAMLLCITANGADERLWLDAKINGKPARMVFDSGASGLFLTKQGAERLGLKFTRSPQLKIQPDTKPPLGITEPCELTVLESSFKVQMSVLDLPGYIQPEMDGILGWDPLSGNIFLIDASAQSVVPLTKVPAEVEATWIKFRLQTNNEVLCLEIPKKKHNVVICVDTGDHGGVSLNPRSWRDWRKKHHNQPATMNSYFMPGAGLVTKEETWAAKLKFGPFSLTQVPVTEANPEQVRISDDEHFEASFGLAALQRLDMVVDGEHGVAYIRPKKTPPVPYKHNRLGAVFAPSDLHSDNLIAHVAAKSPAEEAGIKNGDVLLKIGDVDVTKWRSNPGSRPNEPFQANPAGTKFELTLQRGEKTFKANVVLRDILLPETNSPMKNGVALTKNTNGVPLEKSFHLGSDESNAALLGRECAIIWFASESKTFTEERIEKDILAAPILAKALGVNYDEKQFRNAFKKTDHKVADDFDSLFPKMIEKEKNSRCRDAYLFSFWCTASRLYVNLVPLFKEPEKQETARKWVATPLAHAWKIATAHDPAIASKCEDVGVRCLSEPLNTFDLADKFASEIQDLQKALLLKFMTADEVEMVIQPFLQRKPR